MSSTPGVHDAMSISTLKSWTWGGLLNFAANAGGGNVTYAGLNTAIHNANTRYVLGPANSVAAALLAYSTNSASYGVWAACTNNGTLSVNFNAATGETGTATFFYASFIGGKSLTLT